MKTEVTFSVRQATREDFAKGKNLLINRMYWVKRITDGEFEGPYYTYKNMELQDLAKYLKNGMAYVIPTPMELVKNESKILIKK